MSIFERVKSLSEKQGLSLAELERKLNLSTNSLYKLKNQKPSADRIELLADYFQVSTDYLLGRTTNKYSQLEENQNNDLSNTMAELLQHIDHNEALMFDGEILDEETKDLLMASIQHSMQVARTLNKKK